MFADLHLHSQYSDGTLTPEELDAELRKIIAETAGGACPARGLARVRSAGSLRSQPLAELAALFRRLPP